MQQAYFNQCGEHQKMYDRLRALTPSQGSASDPLAEVLRLLVNAYADFYNNGGGNASKWEFVDPIVMTQHPDIHNDIFCLGKIHGCSSDVRRLRNTLLAHVKKFRSMVTKVGCFLKKSETPESVFAAAERAIDSLCAFAVWAVGIGYLFEGELPSRTPLEASFAGDLPRVTKDNCSTGFFF